MKMTEMSAVNTQSIADYLAQLLKDRKQITAFPNMFMHVERLIDEGKYLSFALLINAYRRPIFRFRLLVSSTLVALDVFAVFSCTVRFRDVVIKIRTSC